MSPSHILISCSVLFSFDLNYVFLAKTGSTGLQLYQQQYAVTGLTKAKTCLRNLCDSKFQVLFPTISSDVPTFATSKSRIKHLYDPIESKVMEMMDT